MKDIHNHILYGIDDGSENYKKSIEILKRHVHIAINPDWTDEEIDELTKKTINARN